MSQYIILIQYVEDNPYTGKEGLPYYAQCRTGREKYLDGSSYFSSNIRLTPARFLFSKTELPAALRFTQRLVVGSKNPRRCGKANYGKVFVLKVGSPKLAAIMAI